MIRSLQRRLANFVVRHTDLLEVGWTAAGASNYSPRDQEAWLLAYRKNRVLRAVVNKVASSVAQVKIYLVKDGRDGRPKVVKSHPFLDWMKNPWTSCGGGSFSDLLRLRQVHYEVTGEAFWFFQQKGKTLESIPLVPPRVQFPKGERKGYSLTKPAPGLPPELPADKVVWFRDIDPSDPYGRGLGLATCLDDEVSQLESSAKFNNAFFENDATPNAIVAMPGIKAALREKIKEQWEARHQGATKSHRVAFVDVDTKVNQLGFSHKDLDFIEGQCHLRDGVLQTWGMPPEIMGINEDSNKATAQEALDLYQENTILPRDISLVFDLQRLVLPLFGGDQNVYIAFESPVRETEQFKHQKRSEMFTRGATTRDEYRVSQGESPIGGDRGAEILQPSNTVPVTASQGVPVQAGRRLLVPLSHCETRDIHVPDLEAA
jgi:HK97 family phage portal protein